MTNLPDHHASDLACGSVLRESSLLSASNAKRFRSLIATLLYFSKRTRPDLLTLVASLMKRLQSPTEDDRTKVLGCTRYLTGIADLLLTLEVKGPVRVTAFVDASFATHISNMKSHTRVYIALGKGEIHCRSSNEKLATKIFTSRDL